MTSKETPTTPAPPSASATTPSVADLEMLRLRFLACQSVTQAVDTTAAWLAQVLSTSPPVTGARVIACLRLARPSGTLRSVRVLVNGGPCSEKIHTPRAALANFGARAADVNTRDRKDDCILAGFRGVVPSTSAVMTSPIWGVQGLWGLLCIGFEGAEPQAAWMQQVLRVAARRLSDYLECQHNVLKASVLDVNPRTPLGLNDFFARVEQAATAAPAETGERVVKSGLAMLVYSCGALTQDVNARRRWIQTVARAALGAMRDGDFASILGDDAIAFALVAANAGACGAVAQRVRETLGKQIPEAALGGFAFQCFEPRVPVKVADLARLAEQARAKRVMKTR